VIPADGLVGDAAAGGFQSFSVVFGFHRAVDDAVIHIREVSRVSHCTFAINMA
jgi:hypothetical protein